jgi:hypothetical protein
MSDLKVTPEVEEAERQKYREESVRDFIPDVALDIKAKAQASINEAPGARLSERSLKLATENVQRADWVKKQEKLNVAAPVLPAEKIQSPGKLGFFGKILQKGFPKAETKLETSKSDKPKPK